MGAHQPRRLERLDALRGIAVFGILLVNVWGLATGAQALRYGVLGAAATNADRLAIFLVAALAEAKFYPIFAFLFGAGLALQMRSLRRALESGDAAAGMYRRRLRWLLACGLLHGLLLWYGDILTTYAVTGFLMLNLAGRRQAVLLRALCLAVLVSALLTLVIVLGTAGIAHDRSEIDQFIAEAAHSSAVFATGNWREIGMLRLRAFGTNLANMLFFVPEVAALFLLGTLAVRRGWLADPARHRLLWRRVQLAGLGLGIPFNLAWGALALAEAADPHTYVSPAVLMHALLTFGGPLLAAGYVASVILAGQGVHNWLARIFAPVGRMALSNYLMQSVLAVLMLQGVGLGFAGALSKAGLLGFCASVMLFQAVLSRWWLGRHAQGPVEALWRRYTYRKLS